MNPGNLRSLMLLVGPVVAALAYFALAQFGWEAKACWTGAITTLCAIWWIFEPVPIPVTSMLPLALLPVFGVLTPPTRSGLLTAAHWSCCCWAGLFSLLPWKKVAPIAASR